MVFSSVAKRVAWRDQMGVASNRWWLVLGFVALLGVLLMIIHTYGFYRYSGDPLARRGYRTAAQEFLIFPYYFTFIANVTAIIVPALQLSGLVKLGSSHLQRYKIMMATNLTITLIVYWALLSADVDYGNALSVVRTVWVHALTPVVAVAVFLYECYAGPGPRTVKLGSTVLINLSMPFAWLAFAIVMYFILGAHGKQDAPYNFLNVAHNPWYLTLVYVVGIAMGYIGFTAIFTLCWTRRWRYYYGRLINKKAPSGA